ncbi:MAG: hypothetical protein AB7T31_07060 [Gemmatimonadales bacterium]
MRFPPHGTRRQRALLVASLACGVVAQLACHDTPTDVVSSGTISGIPFTVLSGVVKQPAADGPISGEVSGSGGALIVLDADPAALGMSDPRRLHVRTTFALRHGGTITMAGFGTSADPLGGGTAVVIGRNEDEFEYAFYVADTVFADSAFVPRPAQPNVEHTVVAEFYAEDVPGYGAGSGITMWRLDDLTPSLGEDVLGCASGPAMGTGTLAGDRMAFALADAFILAVEVVDTIVGPCT